MKTIELTEDEATLVESEVSRWHGQTTEAFDYAKKNDGRVPSEETLRYIHAAEGLLKKLERAK